MKEILSVEVRVECGKPFGPYEGSELKERGLYTEDDDQKHVMGDGE